MNLEQAILESSYFIHERCIRMINGRRELNIQCPACGHRAASNKQAPNCTINLDSRESAAWKCFCCDAYGNAKLDTDTDELIVFQEGKIIYGVGRQPVASSLSYMPLPLEHKSAESPHQWLVNPERIDITDIETVKLHWQDYEPTIDELIVEQWGLVVGRVYEYSDNELAYPVYGKFNKIEGYRHRHDRKWRSVAGTGAYLFHKHRFGSVLKRNAIVVISESPVEAMLGWRYYQSIASLNIPIAFVAGTNGAGTWSDVWSRTIYHFHPRHVMIIFDNDTAGERGAAKVASSLHKVGIRSTLDSDILPDGKDLRDLMREEVTTGKYDKLFKRIKEKA